MKRIGLGNHFTAACFGVAAGCALGLVGLAALYITGVAG